MFFPHGFLSGVLQTHARYYKAPFDNLEFSFEILAAEGAEQIEKSPKDGVYVHGLFIDGARWDREGQVLSD